jgi:hypothetical protein
MISLFLDSGLSLCPSVFLLRKGGRALGVWVEVAKSASVVVLHELE